MDSLAATFRIMGCPMAPTTWPKKTTAKAVCGSGSSEPAYFINAIAVESATPTVMFVPSPKLRSAARRLG